VTVLSRCQRFDLRRVDASVLMEHLARIAEREKISAEAEALRQIARAAEGSVRDALSILDQAIAHGAGNVEAATVEGMLGLADRTRVVDLFEHAMRGDAAAALAEMDAQHAAGADPEIVLTDLADFCHYVTRLKLAPNAAQQAAISETERVRGGSFAETLSLRELARAWQILVKGLEEVGLAARPRAAAEMVLVRLCHAADLPTPDEAIRMVTGNGAAPSPPPPIRAAPSGAGAQAVRTQAAPQLRAEAVPAAHAAPMLKNFDDVIARAKAERDRLLVFALERHVRPIRFEQGHIEIALTENAEPSLPQKLGQILKSWTGERWMVSVSRDASGVTAHETRIKNEASLLDEARADPLVQKLLQRFPGAEIVSVRERGVQAEAEPEVAPIAGEFETDDTEEREGGD
jgi:DNA polymerase-3 subunit gamma/tau